MKHLLFQALSIFALCSVALACGESRSPTNNAQRYVALDHAAEAARIAAGAQGLALAVVEHGKLVHAVGFGQQGLTRSGAVTKDTQFRIGSMTKVLTAIGVLELVDAGKVDLDAPLVQYVPEFTLTANPDEVRTITIGQLLTHSSGLPDAPVAWFNWPDTSDAVLDGYLTSKAFADKYKLLAPPGRIWMYSNLGFDLLGLVIERVSREPYVQYIQQHVITPLGMTRTTFSADEVVAGGNYAMGETAAGAEVDAVVSNIPWQRPSGLAFSTVIDLSKLMTFLMVGTPPVLSPAMHDKMVAPTFNTELYGNRIQWGLGVEITHGLRDDNLDTVGHTGELRGNSTVGIAYPSLHLAVVYIVNKSTSLDQILRSALATLADQPELPLASWPEDPSHFDRYVGHYRRTDTGGEVEVTLVDNQVRVQNTGHDCTLESVAPGSLRCPADGFFYSFLPTGGGEVEYLRVLENVGEWVAKRDLRFCEAGGCP